MEHGEKELQQTVHTEELVPYFGLAENSPYDFETIHKAMMGDKDAFTVLFMQTYRRMYYVVRTILHNDEDIYDALQIGYTKAYRYISRLSSPEKFLPWLKRTMENTARDIYTENSEHGAVSYDEHEDECYAPDQSEENERRADICEVLSRMDPRQAKVLILYFYDGMKLSDISKLLDEPASTVRSRFHTAKKELIKLLKIKGIDSSLYGGSISAMIAVSLRFLIGTDILSAATAQQMLDKILSEKHDGLGTAAYKLLEKQRNKSILRAVSLLMALTVIVACITVIIVIGVKDFEKPLVPYTSSSGTGATVSSNSSSMDTDDTAHHESSVSTEITDGSDTPSSSTTLHSSADTSDTGSTPTNSPTFPVDPFVPDYRPGYANITMRYPNNLSRFGLIDQQDDWIYFVRPNTFALEKIRKHGGESTVLFEPTNEIAALNVIGDWIYYAEVSSGIYRIRTDGTRRERLAAGNCCKTAYFINNVLYYGVFLNNPGSSPGSIYRYDIAREKKEPVLSDIPFNNIYDSHIFYMTDQHIVYFSSNGSDISLLLFTLSTGQSKAIVDFHDQRPSDFLIDGNHIYWAECWGKSQKIMQIDYTAQNPKPVTIYQAEKEDPEAAFYLEFLNTTDRILGFTQMDGTLFLLHTETKECRKADFQLSDVFETIGQKKNGYYAFEPGWIWGVTPAGTWARVCYNEFGYAEYS